MRGQFMQNTQLWRRKHLRRRGAVLVAGLAVAGPALGGMAFGAAAKPKMQVLPSPYGLKYSQTVRVKAQNLPKGSGTIALTICGLNTAQGSRIASPTADDCAGADDLNSGLVKLQQWKDGTFDQQYKLPKSGQKFGENKRFCDAKHNCALVVADANPDKPAYHVDTQIQFTDQKKPATSTTKPKPATTKPKPTTTTTTQPDFSLKFGVTANAGPAGGSASGAVSVDVHAPDTAQPPATPPTVTVPAPVGDSVTEACGQVADAIEQGGGDASALTIACSTLVNGGGGAQLSLLLHSPSFACVGVGSATEGNAQLADACSQLATALQPYSSQLGDALHPVLGLLP
jgi:hypothetical protein